MPSRDEKSRQTYAEIKDKIDFSNSDFEQMSVPDGGKGNKEALDSLKRANK